MALVLSIRHDTDAVVLSWGGAKKALVRVVSHQGSYTKIAIEAPHGVSIGRTNPNEKAPREPWEDKKRRPA